MIELQIPAQLKCSEAGCLATQTCKLVLSNSGNIAGMWEDSSWQVLPNKEPAVFVAFCPMHSKKVEPARIMPATQIGPAGMKPPDAAWMRRNGKNG